MKNSWAVRNATDEVLELSAQLGVKNIVVYGGSGLDAQIGSTDVRIDYRNTFDDYVAIHKRMESYGLNLVACEGGFLAHPKYHDLVFGGPKRDAIIDGLASEITDMGRAGIPIFGYHWMPAYVWRSEAVKIRDGADATAWDSNSLNQFAIQEISIAGHYDVSIENMWNCLEYWIKAITPVAETAGIRLGIHPDDPPVPELARIPRLLGSFEAFKRLVAIMDSPSNAIEFCQGTFSEMEGEDIYQMIEYFTRRQKVLYVHFRNVSGTVPKFNEEFTNTGYVNMKRAMEIYHAAGYAGVFMDDHCPLVNHDAEFPGNWGGYRSRVFAQGYIQAMIEAVTVERIN